MHLLSRQQFSFLTLIIALLRVLRRRWRYTSLSCSWSAHLGLSFNLSSFSAFHWAAKICWNLFQASGACINGSFWIIHAISAVLVRLKLQRKPEPWRVHIWSLRKQAFDLRWSFGYVQPWRCSLCHVIGQLDKLIAVFVDWHSCPLGLKMKVGKKRFKGLVQNW